MAMTPKQVESRKRLAESRVRNMGPEIRDDIVRGLKETWSTIAGDMMEAGDVGVDESVVAAESAGEYVKMYGRLSREAWLAWDMFSAYEHEVLLAIAFLGREI